MASVFVTGELRLRGTGLAPPFTHQTSGLLNCLEEKRAAGLIVGPLNAASGQLVKLWECLWVSYLQHTNGLTEWSSSPGRT